MMRKTGIQEQITVTGDSDHPDIRTLRSLAGELEDGEILSLSLEGVVLSDGQEEE